MPKPLPQPKRLVLERIIAKLPTSAPDEALGFDLAVKEIKTTLSLPHEAAMALMCGLCATGAVRSFDDQGKSIDPAIAPMGDAARPQRVSMVDLREWMRSACHVSSDVEAAILRRVRAGDNPGRSVSWKEFCDGIRDDCNGWQGKDAKRRPARGFGDKQIQRIHNDLKRL